MSLLITAGVVATGLGAFIAGLVVAALTVVALMRGTRRRLRTLRESRARQHVSAGTPRWALAWRRWAPAVPNLSEGAGRGGGGRGGGGRGMRAPAYGAEPRRASK